ncbi:hypothetical protein ACUXAV_006518 [Cupriavidus metallidurans]
METTAVGWQLDFFGEAAAIVVPPPKVDPLPDPSLWSESVREQMIDALISLACDSRRGDNMSLPPQNESLAEVKLKQGEM